MLIPAVPRDRPNRTRIQRATKLKGETAWTRFSTVAGQMFREEGPSAFYKGITPRVARVAPGQAVVFTVYERIKRWVSFLGLPLRYAAAAPRLRSHLLDVQIEKPDDFQNEYSE